MAISSFFTLNEASQLIGLKPEDKWRVINFALGKEYGIKPSARRAAGSGSRRLYELNDVCEIVLALRLLETGLRSKVIGKVIKQLREQGRGGGVQRVLDLIRSGESEVQLVVIRTPLVGKPLSEKREQTVKWIATFDEMEKMVRMNPDRDLIFVPVSALFSEFNKRLQTMLTKWR